MIAPVAGDGASPVPENIATILSAAPDAAAETLRRWLVGGILLHERRPGLWIYRQTIPLADGNNGQGAARVLAMLIGLVRLPPTAAAPGVAPSPSSERVARLRALRADFEPLRIRTRAPLAGALATTRGPDLSATDSLGVRHDAFRVTDYAQHVELQGIVKNAEMALLDPTEAWDAARAFQADPDAAKLPGARFKLGALVDETFLDPGLPPPAPVPAGLFGFSLEDPVY